MTKAAKQPHVVGEAQVRVHGRRDTFEVRPDPSLPQGDYRQLVHELDEAEYWDIRLMVMEIRNAYVRRRGQGWAEAAFPGHPFPDPVGWG